MSNESIVNVGIGNAKCTTISTIAVRSLGTQVVIALLQTPTGFSLKILEMTPKLSFLPRTAEDATEALTKHQEVLQKLRAKTTPVEELLRQVDGNVTASNAETYSAMTDSLSVAWKDLNRSLESKEGFLQSAKKFHGYRSTCLNYFSSLYLDKKEVLITYRYAVEEGRRLLTKLSTLLNDEAESASYSINMVDGWMDELQQNLLLWKCGIKQLKNQTFEAQLLEIFAKEIEKVETKLKSKEGTLNDRRKELLHISSKIDSSALPSAKSTQLQRKIYNLLEQITITMEVEEEYQQFTKSCIDLDDPQAKMSFDEKLNLLKNSDGLKEKIEMCKKWEEILVNVNFSKEEIERTIPREKDFDMKLLETEEATEKLKQNIFHELKQEIQVCEQEWNMIMSLEDLKNLSNNLNLTEQKLNRLKEIIAANDAFNQLHSRCKMVHQKIKDANNTLDNLTLFITQYANLDDELFLKVYQQKEKEVESSGVPIKHPLLQKLLKRIEIRKSYDELMEKPFQCSENEIIRILNQDSELEVQSALDKIFAKRLELEKQQFELEMEEKLESESLIEEQLLQEAISDKARLEEIEMERQRQEAEELQKHEDDIKRQRIEDLELQRQKYEIELIQQREAEELQRQHYDELKRQQDEELQRKQYEELKRQQDEELQKQQHYEELKKREEAEELQRKQYEELERQQAEKVQRKQYEKLKRKQDEELMKHHEAELKQKDAEKLQKLQVEELIMRQEYENYLRAEYEQEQQRLLYYDMLSETDHEKEKPSNHELGEQYPLNFELTLERSPVQMGEKSTTWTQNNTVCQAELMEYQKFREFGDIQLVDELQVKQNAFEQQQKIDELMTTLDFPLPENLETTRNDLRDFGKLEEIVETMENPPLYLIEKMYEKKDKIIKCSRFYELVEKCDNYRFVMEIKQLENELFGPNQVSNATLAYEVQPVEVAVTHEDPHRYSADEKLLAMLDTEVETIFEQAQAKFLSHNETQTELAETQPEPILLIMNEPAKLLSSTETQTKVEPSKCQHTSSSQTELLNISSPNSAQNVDNLEKETLVLIQQEPAKLALDSQTQTPMLKSIENTKYEVVEEMEEQFLQSTEFPGVMRSDSSEKLKSLTDCDTQTHEPSPKLLQNVASQTKLEAEVFLGHGMEKGDILPTRKLSIKEKIAAWNQQALETNQLECHTYISNDFRHFEQTQKIVQVLKPDEKTTTEKNILEDNLPSIKDCKKLFEESYKTQATDVKPEQHSAFVPMPKVGRFKELFEQEQPNNNLHFSKSEEIEKDLFSTISGRRSVTDYKKLFETNQPSSCVKEIRNEKKYDFESNSYINTYTEEIKSPALESPRFEGRIFDKNPEAFYEYDSYRVASSRPESSLSFEMWPSKFVPARFTESDYESDDFKICEPVWKPTSGSNRPISAFELGQGFFAPPIDSINRPGSSTSWKPIPPPKPSILKVSNPIPTTSTNVKSTIPSKQSTFCKSPATITSEHVLLEFDEPISSSEFKHKEISSTITKTEECKFLLRPVKTPELDDLQVIRRTPSTSVNYYVSVTTPPINLPIDNNKDIVKESKLYTKETYYEEKTGRELGSIQESYTGISPTFTGSDAPTSFPKRPKSTNEYSESHWMQKTTSEGTYGRPRSAEIRSIYVSEAPGRPKSSEMYHEIKVEDVEDVSPKSVKEIIHKIQMNQNKP